MGFRFIEKEIDISSYDKKWAMFTEEIKEMRKYPKRVENVLDAYEYIEAEAYNDCLDSILERMAELEKVDAIVHKEVAFDENF